MELLAPAGDFEKLCVAINYGADAVYCSGKAFGLRSAAGNFSLHDLEKAINFVKRRAKKLFLTLNTFPTQEDMRGIEGLLRQVKDFEIDALIVADAGVFALAKAITRFPLHISTQASTTNFSAADFWMQQGAARVILAREVSISEAHDIKKHSPIELEMFIHGSMCMAYSGNCTISNYTSNRDANRGGCVNSCRWEYGLQTLSGELLPNKLYIMNSKDLWAVTQIKAMMDAGIDSLKIEGRMKSQLYLANAVSTYRQIIDYYSSGKTPHAGLFQKWKNKLASVPNRDFSEGFLNGVPGLESVLHTHSKAHTNASYAGVVRECLGKRIVLQVKNPFCEGDLLKALLFNGEEVVFQVEGLCDLLHTPLEKAQPNSLVLLHAPLDVHAQSVIAFEQQSSSSPPEPSLEILSAGSKT